MPLLAAFLGGIFTNLVTFFTSYMTKRLAIIAAVVTAFLALTGAFVASVNTAIQGISRAMPAEMGIAASWVVPDNFEACVAAYLATELTAWVYSWNVRIIQYKLI
jgi:predicted PurR-regulated permease PerM